MSQNEMHIKTHLHCIMKLWKLQQNFSDILQTVGMNLKECVTYCQDVNINFGGHFPHKENTYT